MIWQLRNPPLQPPGFFFLSLFSWGGGKKVRPIKSNGPSPSMRNSLWPSYNTQTLGVKIVYFSSYLHLFFLSSDLLPVIVAYTDLCSCATTGSKKWRLTAHQGKMVRQDFRESRLLVLPPNKEKECQKAGIHKDYQNPGR